MIFPRLEEWFELIKENYEEPVVKCDGCSKEFRNNPLAKLIIGNDKYYACCGDCKGKVSDRARKEKKK